MKYSSKKTNGTNRGDKVSSLAQRELADILRNPTTRELKHLTTLADSAMISVSNVIVEKGCQHIRFYISIYGHPSPDQIMNLLNAQNSSIRGELTRRMQLRMAPTISFHLDGALEHSQKINTLLDQIMVEE